jgi:hypothetical protein
MAGPGAERMTRARSPRVSRARVLRDLQAAARRGDRAALTLAVDQMRTLALSPRYWEAYLALLRHPLARLVDLLVIKQGERIAELRGWRARGHRRGRPARPRRARAPRSGPEQPPLFPLEAH